MADGESVVLEIDVPGAREIKRQLPEAVLVFIAPPDLADLEERLAGRGANTADEIQTGSPSPATRSSAAQRVRACDRE